MTITVVLGTAVAFTAYLWGVDRIGPVRASLVAAPNPSRRPCSPPSSWEAPTRVPTSSARPSSSVPL